MKFDAARVLFEKLLYQQPSYEMADPEKYNEMQDVREKIRENTKQLSELDSNFVVANKQFQIVNYCRWIEAFNMYQDPKNRKGSAYKRWF